MRCAEWMVERPWRLVALVLLVAAPLLILAEFAVDTQVRVEKGQRENLRSLALRGAEATASRTGAHLDKLVGVATTSRLRGAIGLSARADVAATRQIIEPPDLRELSFQLDSFHAVMRDDVATLLALDGGGVVLETDPPGARRTTASQPTKT